MKLSLKELRAFKDSASFVKTNPLLPILSYIKFDSGRVTKNNLNEFVIQEIECTQQFLIEERILFGFIATASDDITVTIKDNKITLDDGYTKVKSVLGDYHNYPTTDIPDEYTFTVTPEVVEAISSASKFINPTSELEMMKYVYVGNKMVSGSDGFIAYMQPFSDDLPNIILTQSACNAISKMNGAKFNDNQSYYFFQGDGICYGFIKPEQKAIDFTPFTKYTESASFVTDRGKFIKFNDVAINSGQSKALRGVMTLNGSLHLTMDDSTFGVDVSKDLVATGEMEGEFVFNPVLMNRLLKSLPENQLKFTQADKRMYITGESNYLTLIMQMQ